jgi:hypothetical protein
MALVGLFLHRSVCFQSDGLDVPTTGLALLGGTVASLACTARDVSAKV